MICFRHGLRGLTRFFILKSIYYPRNPCNPCQNITPVNHHLEGSHFLRTERRKQAHPIFIESEPEIGFHLFRTDRLQWKPACRFEESGLHERPAYLYALTGVDSVWPPGWIGKLGHKISERMRNDLTKKDMRIYVARKTSENSLFIDLNRKT